MGSNVSTQTSNNLESAVTNIVNKQNSSTSTKVTCDSNSSQKMNSGSVNAEGCSIDITQSTNVKLDCLIKSANNFKEDQSSSVLDDLESKVQQALAQKMKGLELAQSQVADINASASTFIKNNAQNIINTSIKNTMNLNASSSKEIDIKSIQCSGGGTIKLTQDGIVNSIAKASVTSGVDQFNKYIGQDTVKQLDKQKSSQTIAGLNMSIIFIIIGIVVLGVLGLAVYFVTTSEKTAVKGVTGVANAASNVTTLSKPTIMNNPVPQPQHLGNID